MEVKEQKLFYQCNTCQSTIADVATSAKLKLYEEKKYQCLSCEEKAREESEKKALFEKSFPKMSNCDSMDVWNSDQVYEDFLLRLTYDDGGYHPGCTKIFTFPMIKLFTESDIDQKNEISPKHRILSYYPRGWGPYSRIIRAQVIEKTKKFISLK